MRRFLTTLLITLTLTISSLSAMADTAFKSVELAPHEQVFEKSTYKINAIDPTVSNNWSASMYPGLRGANQLVVYTQSFGNSTGTNEFGAEAIVEGNVVTSLSGADSIIPSNGLVISAHGRAKTWLNKNIHIGTKVFIDANNQTITALTTSDSYVFAAKEKIIEATTMMNYYQKNSLTYNSRPTRELINNAKHYLRRAQRSNSDVQEYAIKAMNYANQALATAIPYKSNELKGIWIRPTSKTEAGIISTLDKLETAGINNVFLETYFHGRTIFPSQTMEKYGFIVQNPNFEGIDPLKIWITEAHKRGIKVHIWFESFYIGNKPQVNNTILAVNPDWSNVNLRSVDAPLPVSSSSEHNGYFLDPANPAVQTFLKELITVIITTYNPDGINLDYIRYPQSVRARYMNYAASNWGYTKYARDEFKLIYGEDPANLTYSSKLWREWDKYRQDKITLFVDSVSKICRQNKITLTAVVFPDKYVALETKQQDWVTWSENNYIDAFTLLFLTCDAKSIKVMIYNMLKEMSPRTKLYAGLFVTFMGGSEEDLIRQIHETRKLNLGGVILFDFAHLQEKYIKTLTISVFSSNSCSNIQPKNINNKGCKYDRAR